MSWHLACIKVNTVIDKMFNACVELLRHASKVQLRAVYRILVALLVPEVDEGD